MIAIAFLLLVPVAQATTLRASMSMMMEHRQNPIRKVVTMLQHMQKQVAAEGEKQKEAYDKFMCYCKTGSGDLDKSISDAETKIPQLEAEIKEGDAKLKQLKEDLKTAEADRKAAKKAMAEATGVREKEHATYEKDLAEDQADHTSTVKAIAALEAGLGNTFLQTPNAAELRSIAQKDKYEDSQRDAVMAFLSQAAGSPGTEEIIGILQQMSAEMEATMKDATAVENDSQATYDALMAAKSKEVIALSKAIEEKTQRVGELAVAVVEMKHDLEDTEQALAEDKKLLATLEKGCATKKKEHEELVKVMGEELVALADTIKVLNDDDALELFKKTLPSASSFMQLQVTAKAVRAKALEVIQGARKANKLDRQNLDFIALALRGRKVGFEQVIGMIDEMVGQLKTEQQDDDEKKEYCQSEFDKADDKKKTLEREIKNLHTEADDTKEGIASATEDIEALQEGIKKLDKSVAEATEQRKEEHAEYVDLMAQDSAAKEVLGFAKNRLNKFYNPKLYKPPPQPEMTDMDRATVAAGGTLTTTPAGGIAGTGIEALAQVGASQPGAMGQESNGVIQMIDILIKDLDKEMTVAETEEKDAQEDYEQMMKDSAEKRAGDSKALENKEAAKADMEESLQKNHESTKAATKELGATEQYIMTLHADCDWLLKYFDVRMEARASETDALEKAKAVLNGADYSLVQTKTQHKFLRRA
jgi:septal ring factor EnvC (AmiA/AmiB activator)